MSTSVHLRTPTEDDAPALVPLFAELGYTVSERTVRTNVRDLANGQADRAWVAESQVGVVGLISVHLTPLFHDTGFIGRVTSLVVHEPLRGSGIGSALMQKVGDFCWQAGCDRIELTSGDHRDQAHSFYARLGFQVHSRRFVMHRTPPNSSFKPKPLRGSA